MRRYHFVYISIVGRVVGSEVRALPTDEAAVAYARTDAGSAIGLEIWHGKDLVFAHGIRRSPVGEDD